MAKKILERCWNSKYELRNHLVLKSVYDDIREDIRAGSVFPALREKEIHLYHGGGRILRIKPRSACTHSKYWKGGGDCEISIPKLRSEEYRTIKENCQSLKSNCLRSGEYPELWIVAQLFERFSLWSKNAPSDQPKLIDIEVRLRRGEMRSSCMIDLLFQDDSEQLTFIEVKRQHDSRVRSKEGTPKDIEKQLKAYRYLLSNSDDILSAYKGVGNALSNFFGLREFTDYGPPTRVFQKVPLLICRHDEKWGFDTWLKTRLVKCAEGEISCDLVVDGGALKECAYTSTKPPPWCPDGLWRNLDLDTVFKDIHGRTNFSPTKENE